MADDRGIDAAGYLGWFFLGALAGAAAALLLAPKSGRETREFLAEQGGDLVRRAHKAADDAQHKAADLFEKGRGYVDEQSRRLASAFEAGRSAMKEEMSKPGAEG